MLKTVWKALHQTEVITVHFFKASLVKVAFTDLLVTLRVGECVYITPLCIISIK